MPLRINGLTTGSITLAAPNTGTDVTLTLPTTALATESFASSAPGLQLITTQNFSAASTVSVNNCFSSTYENYRVVFSPGATGTSSALTFRFRANGVDGSSNMYFYGGFDVNQNGASGVRTGSSATSVSLTTLPPTYGLICNYSIDVFRPAIPNAPTNFAFLASNHDGTVTFASYVAGTYYIIQALDGISFNLASSSHSGSVRIYGYRN